jgi:hypothetical protein
MTPFPDSDDCLSALLDAFAHAAEQGPAAAAGSAGEGNGHAVGTAGSRIAPSFQREPLQHGRSAEQQARQHVRTALDGVDFLTRMHVSAALSGRGFLACCKELGIHPHSLTLAQRRALDDQMSAHFRQTADVDGLTHPETANALLRSLLAGMKRASAT